MSSLLKVPGVPLNFMRLFHPLQTRLAALGIRFFCIGLLGMMIVACTSADDDPRACPRVAILQDAATVTVFSEPGALDMTDVLARGALSNIRGGCEYFDDEVEVAFDVTLSAERGPALDASQFSFDYFVTILTPSGAVYAKEVFRTPVSFPSGVFRAGALESLSQTIPLQSGADGRGFSILIGFQLTQHQVEYNRRSRS
ncbi:MAG: hypothetical protein AAF213_00650 [Pseudomonadota bacterium]